MFSEPGSADITADVDFKFLAKIASDINKPNGIKIITREEVHEFLDQLPVNKFHGVAKAWGVFLQQLFH